MDCTDKAIHEWDIGAKRIPERVAGFVSALLADVDHLARADTAIDTYRDTVEPITLLCYRDPHEISSPHGPLPLSAHRAVQLRIARTLREAGHAVTLQWAPPEIPTAGKELP